MSRLTKLSALAALAIAGAVTAQTAAADAAVVITNTSCVLPDASGGLFASNDVRQFTVITESGRINHYCHGKLPDDSVHPDRAVRLGSADFGGALCVTPGGGATSDWQAIVTPSGNVSINCNDA